MSLSAIADVFHRANYAFRHGVRRFQKLARDIDETDASFRTTQMDVLLADMKQRLATTDDKPITLGSLVLEMIIKNYVLNVRKEVLPQHVIHSSSTLPCVQDLDLERRKYSEAHIVNPDATLKVYVHHKSSKSIKVSPNDMIYRDWKPLETERLVSLHKILDINPLANMLVQSLTLGVLAQLAKDYCEEAAERTTDEAGQESWEDRCLVFEDYSDDDMYDWLNLDVAELTIDVVDEMINRHGDLAKGVAEWEPIKSSRYRN